MYHTIFSICICIYLYYLAYDLGVWMKVDGVVVPTQHVVPSGLWVALVICQSASFLPPPSHLHLHQNGNLLGRRLYRK